jgi:oxygen-dependent protoporphyrinogen oxidase
LRRGMGSLIEALLADTTLVRARVESVAPAGTMESDAGGWMIFSQGEWIFFDAVVLACGANHSAPLIAPLDSRAAELLAGIPHTGSAIWTFIYERESVKHPLDGFGFLVPSLERRSLMACTWVGTKWAGRVPDDKAVFRCFSTYPDVTRDAIEADLVRLMDISGAPVATVHHRWPDSMPQYTVGHMTRIAELERRVAQIPGVYLAGNAYHGIGVPDCVKSGRDTAAAMATRV